MLMHSKTDLKLLWFKRFLSGSKNYLVYPFFDALYLNCKIPWGFVLIWNSVWFGYRYELFQKYSFKWKLKLKKKSNVTLKLFVINRKLYLTQLSVECFKWVFLTFDHNFHFIILFEFSMYSRSIPLSLLFSNILNLWTQAAILKARTFLVPLFFVSVN